MQYLTDWRLTLARDYLLAGELTLDQIARKTGYTSANAFAATFRRHHGLPPGRWREANAAEPGQGKPASRPEHRLQQDLLEALAVPLTSRQDSSECRNRHGP